NFTTANEFHGVDLGFRAELFWERLTFSVLAKLAAGNLHRQVDIRGEQVTTVPGVAPTTEPAGMLALASNSGTHISNEGIVLYDLGAALGWQPLDHIQFRVGYSALYLGKVARAADQVNLTVNPTQFPPALGT